MAKFQAFSNFDIRDLSLSWYAENFFEEFLARNENIKVDGVNYRDWLTVNGFSNDGSNDYNYFIYFAGPTISGSAQEDTVTGTVNLLAENWLSEAGDMYYWYRLSGFSMSAQTILNVVKTPGTSDDLALFSTALKGNDVVTLSQFDDRMNGFAGNDTMLGNGGRDTLYGDAGADRILGGAGRDHLHGGTGADDFVFNDGDTGNSASTRDVIFDFALRSDDLDLRLIDANSRRSGDQNFDFGGTRAGANDVWFARSGSNIIVYGDTNGDSKADFEIELRSISSLSAADFIL